MRETLTGNDAEAEGRADGISVRLLNNTWNVAPRVNGTDFTQTIAYDPADLTRDVVFEWDFGPDDQAGVLSYPQIAFGESPWSRSGATEMVTRVDELRELDVAVDLSIGGRTDQFNVAFDLWLTDTPLGGDQQITTEVMVWLHAPPGDLGLPVVATWSSNGATARIYADDEFSIEPGLEWGYVAVVFDGDVLEGTIDIDGLLRFLTELGLISGDDYISGLELGSEVQGYAGSTTLHSVDLAYSAYDITGGADRLTGTDQDDVVDGRGGADLIEGRSGADRLQGGGGDDQLRGGAGGDHLFGQGGDDTVKGGAGADTVHGGGGNDAVGGGGGRDTLTGSSGDDTFDFVRPTDGADVVTDFRDAPGNDDRLRFDAASFGGGLEAGGAIDPDLFVSHASNRALGREDRFIFCTTDETLWFDADGKAGAGPVMVADLDAGAVVTAADIFTL